MTRLCWIAVLVLASSFVEAQGRWRHSRFGASIAKIAAEIVAPVAESTVKVLGESGDLLALGTVVGADGLILTKASEATGKLTIVLPSGTRLPARRLAESQDWDLLLVAVDRTDLVPVVWALPASAEPQSSTEPQSSAGGELQAGQILVSAGPDGRAIGLGIVGHESSRIPPEAGFLGVNLAANWNAGVRVDNVTRGSAAASAGFAVGDVISGVVGSRVASRRGLVRAIVRAGPGAEMVFEVRRGEEKMNLTATLKTRRMDRESRRLAGPVSLRKGGFDAALQHDTVLRPNECGGPVLDLFSRVVGMNIARAGRESSYAIPAALVAKELRRLQETTTTSAGPPAEDR